MDDIREAAAQAKGGSMHPRTTWGKVFDHPLYKEHFEQPVHSNLPYYEVVTRDNAVQRFLTWSGIAVMDPEAKQKAIDTVVNIISEAQEKATDGLEWENKSEGTFRFPYNAELDICKRK